MTFGAAGGCAALFIGWFELVRWLAGKVMDHWGWKRGSEQFVLAQVLSWSTHLICVSLCFVSALPAVVARSTLSCQLY